VVLDETGRLPGRGAYLCRTGGCGRTALAKGVIGRALGVPLPADVRAALEAAAIATTNETTTNETTTNETTMMSDEGGAGGQE
jgi:predicted RNA-binding protein YlxR (DUF448 family)